MVLLHFVYDVGEYMALRLPARVLAAFILIQAICHSSCRAMHIRTWETSISSFARTHSFGVLNIVRTKQHSICSPYALDGKASMASHSWGSYTASEICIGSTSVSAHSRQDARLRKYRLLQRGDFCNAELMLHYFPARGDLFHAVLIPVHCFESLHQARASEYSFIHSWKPPS